MSRRRRARLPRAAELAELRLMCDDPQILRLPAALRRANLQSWRCTLHRDRLVSALALAHKISRRAARSRRSSRSCARGSARTPSSSRAARRSARGRNSRGGRRASATRRSSRGDRSVALRAHPRRAGRRAAGPAAGARREPAAARRAAAARRSRSRRGAPPAPWVRCARGARCSAAARGCTGAPRRRRGGASSRGGGGGSCADARPLHLGARGRRGRAAALLLSLRVRPAPAAGATSGARCAAARGVHDGAVAARRRARARAAAPPLARRIIRPAAPRRVEGGARRLPDARPRAEKGDARLLRPTPTTPARARGTPRAASRRRKIYRRRLALTLAPARFPLFYTLNPNRYCKPRRRPRRRAAAAQRERRSNAPAPRPRRAALASRLVDSFNLSQDDQYRKEAPLRGHLRRRKSHMSGTRSKPAAPARSCAALRRFVAAARAAGARSGLTSGTLPPGASAPCPPARALQAQPRSQTPCSASSAPLPRELHGKRREGRLQRRDLSL